VHSRPKFEIALLAQEIRPALPWIGVRRMYFRHTYLRVTISIGGATKATYIDGAPSNGYLTLRLGSAPYYQFGGERVIWSSGESQEHAPAALALLGAAMAFPARRRRYLLAVNNSNSVARWLLRTAGLRLPRGHAVKLACDPRYPGWLIGVRAGSIPRRGWWAL
jgi:MYXO-CTERM domain-containing protein